MAWDGINGMCRIRIWRSLRRYTDPIFLLAGLRLLTISVCERKGDFEQSNRLFCKGVNLAAIPTNICASHQRDRFLFHSSNHLAEWNLLHRDLFCRNIYLCSKTKNMGACDTGALPQLGQLVYRIWTCQRGVWFCNLDDSHFLHINVANAIEA